MTATEPGERTLLAGRYRLEEVVGHGGMAEVHRATDLKLDRPVAVKILLEGAGDESDRRRFIDEAKTLAMLSHSGLVMVLDAGFGTRDSDPASSSPEAPERPFLVMDLVDGPTLAQLISTGPLPLDQVGEIAVQVADALAYVHSRGIVHRDVKPGNVLIGADDLVKLADFGIARLIEERSGHTRPGLAIGTASYVAPEQVNQGHVDGAADIYSLGLVLLEAITGRREYDGPPAEAALARFTNPPEIPPLPGVWTELLTAMTAVDPEDRPSAEQVAATLRPVLAASAPVGTAGAPDATTSPILATAGEDVPTAAYDPPTAERETPLISERLPSTAPLAERLRGVSGDTWGVIAAAAALLVLLVVAGIASGTDEAPPIPDNTPADLRGPLIDLHDAVAEDDLGERAPDVADGLDEVDAAIAAGELGEARDAVEDLVIQAAQARVGDEITGEEADAIFEAAGDLLDQLPEPA